MIYRDMTFCGSDCIDTGCPRHFGEDDRKAAKNWWGGPDVPVAYSDFSGGCPEYKPAAIREEET